MTHIDYEDVHKIHGNTRFAVFALLCYKPRNGNPFRHTVQYSLGRADLGLFPSCCSLGWPDLGPFAGMLFTIYRMDRFRTFSRIWKFNKWPQTQLCPKNNVQLKHVFLYTFLQPYYIFIWRHGSKTASSRFVYCIYTVYRVLLAKWNLCFYPRKHKGVPI